MFKRDIGRKVEITKLRLYGVITRVLFYIRSIKNLKVSSGNKFIKWRNALSPGIDPHIYNHSMITFK